MWFCCLIVCGGTSYIFGHLCVFLNIEGEDVGIVVVGVVAHACNRAPRRGE